MPIESSEFFPYSCHIDYKYAMINLDWILIYFTEKNSTTVKLFMKKNQIFWEIWPNQPLYRFLSFITEAQFSEEQRDE